jgi:uroporphyrinogen-III synthase
LIEVIKIIERDTGDKVVMVRADNIKGEVGSKFQNKYKEDGIQFEPCPVYKHSLNGISERAVYMTDYKI